MTVVPLPQTGGCACGALRYRLTAAPLLAYACHCHDCQSRSGSAFTLTLVLQTADLAFEGEREVWRDTTPAGRELDHHFCPGCRTRVLVNAVAAPDYASLRAGTLDDAGWVVPIVQTWVESAIPWAVIPGVRRVSWADFDFHALGAEWRASAPRFAAAEPA